MASLAYKFLAQRGYQNMKVMKEGIPGWQQKRYPMEGPRRGEIRHRPYPASVHDLERRLADAERIKAEPRR